MIIFLAGAHGVGKTFLGKPVAEALNVRYASASSLIQGRIGSPAWNDSKYTSDINRNQVALISAVEDISRSQVHLVLDGHFVLRNEDGFLVELPVDVFKRLKVAGVVLICTPSDVVSNRLRRRGAPQSLENIEELASAEEHGALRVSEELGIPLARLSSPSEEQLRQALEEMFKRY